MELVYESGSKHGNINRKSNSSSSSPSSSEEDFFQLDANELSKTTPDTNSGQLASRADIDLPTTFGARSSDEDVAMPSSQLQHDRMSVTNVFSPDAPGITQSPSIQVMGKSDVPDPYRIPASVFERTKSTTPMEWSVASNESLFSIHVGNSSFSRDHVFLMGRSGELSNFPLPGEMFSPPPPTLSDTNAMNLARRDGLNNNSGATEAANAETMKEVLRAAADEHTKVNAPATGEVPRSSSISRRSDGSATSIRSFAFPILTEGRSGSVKVEPENPVQQQQRKQLSQSEAAEVAPAAENTKWFPCFSCCPFCC